MVKEIVKFIISTLMAIAIIALIIVNVLSSTVLNKDYILSKIQEQNYYDKIYEETKLNFENYIYQSGLDEEVLDDIVSKEKIEKDTKIIINNIYDNANEQIDTEEIRNNLNNKIQNFLGGNIAITQQKSVTTFVDTICKEYESTISHTNYEKKINTWIEKIDKSIKIIKRLSLRIICLGTALIILLSVKGFSKCLDKFGVAFTISGLILIFIKKYINLKIKVDTIVILNNAVSDVLQNVINEILQNILKNGSILLLSGIVLIVISSIVRSIYNSKIKKEQYT